MDLPAVDQYRHMIKAQPKQKLDLSIPSIKEIVVFDAPIDNRNSGITLYTILVDVSVKKLVNPVKKAFFSNPNIFFLFIHFISHSAVSFLMLPNGWRYETLGIAGYFPVQLH